MLVSWLSLGVAVISLLYSIYRDNKNSLSLKLWPVWERPMIM